MGQLWISGPRLWKGARLILKDFPGGCLFVSLATPPGEARIPCQHSGAGLDGHKCLKFLLPSCCLCNAWCVGHSADLEPEQQQAMKQDSDDFPLIEGPVDSSPWLMSLALWLVTME